LVFLFGLYTTHATSPADCWAETYTYDPWGNLLSLGANATTQPAYTGCTQESGFDYTNFTASNNRLTPSSGYSYDSAGNIIAAPGATYTYDAENRLTSTAGVNYTYDGDGKRIMKSTGTIYWYGLNPDPLEETDLAGNYQALYFFFNGRRITRCLASNECDHYFSDHLGNSRFVWSLAGFNQSDFYPFGGERVISSGTSTHYKFTGKERDSESNLDNFGARYFTSSMGRFMSSDPDDLSGAMHMEDPQSWNGYSYVRNNPLNLTDPTGTVFCRAANDAEKNQGVSQVCDVTDAQYVNSSKEQQAAYDKAGYTHFDCSCDTGADKDAWQHRNGNVSTDWIGNGLVFGAVFAGLEGLFYPQLHPHDAAPTTPTPQPQNVNLADQKATTHTLDGDATGGGHRPGTGIPGKSEFPAG